MDAMKNKMETIVMAVVVIILGLAMGKYCYEKYYHEETSYNESIPDTENMPPIILLKVVMSHELNGYESSVSVEFMDNKGRIYYSEDQSVISEGDRGIMEGLTQGTITDKLEYVGSCSNEELRNIFNQICMNKHHDYSLYSPGFKATKENERLWLENYTTYWYAYNYNVDGRLESALIHMYEVERDFTSRFDEINEIYSWYENTIKSLTR